MLNIISSMPKHVINLPKVISFDEFKADTRKGKYAFIINDPILLNQSKWLLFFAF